MRKLAKGIILIAAVFVCISGCDSRTPEKKQYDAAVDRLTIESIDLGRSEKEQNFIQTWIPGMASTEVKLRRERVEAARQEVERAAKNI